MITETIPNLNEVNINPAKLTEARGEMSLSAAARAVGIPRQRLWDYENGYSTINSHVFARLCLLYRKPVEFFT